MVARKQASQWVRTAFVLVVCAGLANATDIWVSGTGDDIQGDGSSGSPFRTITTAMQAANANDTIKVLTGTYTVAVGESFPISIKPGVDILGQETEQVDWPRIGGDVADSSVRALFEVVGDASNGDRTGIILRKLRFEDEDSTGEDAPSAVYLENADGRDAEATLDNCLIERGEMNDTGNDNRASIVVVGGDAEDGANSGIVHLNIIGGSINPTAQGGVEARISTDASSPDRASFDIDVRDCGFALTGSQTSRCAIDLLLDAYDGTTGLEADLECTISGNLIDSRECTGTGASTRASRSAATPGTADPSKWVTRPVHPRQPGLRLQRVRTARVQR